MTLLTDEEIIALQYQDDKDDHFVFARAIEQAVISKLNSAEPVCWITPDGEGWRMRYEPPVTDTNLGWSPLYAHPQAPSAVEGYTLVPNEPTRLMLDAAHIDLDRETQIDVMLKYVWEQMLSAARSE